MAAFLQNYIDSVSDLPAELKRCFLLIRELDQNSSALQTEVDSRCKKHVTEHAAEYQALLDAESPAKRTRLQTQDSPGRQAGVVASKRAEQLDALERDLKQVMNYADEKVAIAQQVYDYVDQRIRRLDKDLKAFDAELTKERGRQGLEDEPNAATGALEAAYPETNRKNRNKKKGGHAVAAAPAVVDAGIPAAVDPNEPVYCYCQRVSFGEMIACDNEECAIEWFHFDCVGLTPENRPKGKWFCKECIQLQQAGK